MAQSTNFFGLRKGSTKSLTFSTLRGKQITKDRVTDVSNPQTTNQMQQRLLLPMVGAARAVLKDLVNHSFEGVNYGDDSLKTFSSLNLAKDALTVHSYVPKGGADTGLADFIISKGSLPQLIVVSNGDEGEAGSYHYIELSSININAADITANETMTTFAQKLISNNSGILSSGDQITILACYLGDEYTFKNSAGTNGSAYYHRYVISRFVVGEDDEINGSWNVTSTAGQSITITDGYLSITFSGDLTIISAGANIGETTEVDFVAAAAILSRRSSDNIYQRSTQRLTILDPDYYNPQFDEVLPTYLKSQASSTKYLNSGVDGVNITGGAVKAKLQTTATTTTTPQS